MDSLRRGIWGRAVIPVVLEPEPPNFDRMVRRRGREFLNQRGVPARSSEFRNYWKEIVADLHRLYDGICAYTCIYLVPPGTTVDHFLPKSKYPLLAYEWSNYRLTSPIMNNRKAEKEGILDPFVVQPGWFTISFPSCLIKMGNLIPPERAQQAKYTIDTLKLNVDDTLVQERCDIIMEYVDRRVALGFLEKRYPFIASELKRQSLADKPENMFRRRRVQK